MHLTNLKSWPWGPTFDSLDPLDSDQGPTRMHLTNLKVMAFFEGEGDFRCIRTIRFGPGSESNASNESKVLALVPTSESLAAFTCMRFRGPGEASWSLNLKSWRPL